MNQETPFHQYHCFFSGLGMNGHPSELLIAIHQSERGRGILRYEESFAANKRDKFFTLQCSAPNSAVIFSLTSPRDTLPWMIEVAARKEFFGEADQRCIYMLEKFYFPELMVYFSDERIEAPFVCMPPNESHDNESVTMFQATVRITSYYLG